MTEIFITAFVIAFIVQAVWYTMQDGEIFSFISDFLAKALPKFMHDPVFECPVCMVPYYGVLIAIIAHFGNFVYMPTWYGWIVCILCAMGINVTLTKIWRYDD